VGLVLRLMPGMRARGSGHIVHSSSIGVLGNLPEFSAYVGSKAAMDAVLRIAGIESRADGVRVTNIHLPLVTTDMIAPTDWSQYASLTLEEGVDMVVDAIRRRSWASCTGIRTEFCPGSSAGCRAITTVGIPVVAGGRISLPKWYRARWR
jgi:NAD(P)-dependent dehydrogenase (short-subunit alcohol dehydrogenase family)